MKGDPSVVKLLGEVLSAELTAINQYVVHAEMCDNWKYHRLSRRIRKEAIDEMKHAEKLIERILYFDTIPNVQRYMKVTIGKDVRTILKNDLELEKEAVARLNRAIEVCAKKDNGSRELLEEILTEEESHIDWIEAQLDQIEQMGYQNYLSAQTGEEG